MASVIQNGNYFLHNTNPDARVNPSQVGAIWVNYTTAKQYVCQDNTLNKNKWVIMNPDVVVPNNSISTDQKLVRMYSWNRQLNVNYLNDTGRPIIVMLQHTWFGSNRLWLYINNIKIMSAGISEKGHGISITGIIPNKNYYKATVDIGWSTVNDALYPLDGFIWHEYR